MMEPLRYKVMSDFAIAQYDFLTEILPQNTDIVFVVSRDVYFAMTSYEDDICVVYNGAPVYCINESEREFFMAVPYSEHFSHCDGIQIGDYVLFNDEGEGLLYELVSVTPPVRYEDTGLTASEVGGAVWKPKMSEAEMEEEPTRSGSALLDAYLKSYSRSDA